MKLIRSRHEFRIAAPESIQTAEAAAAWLASVSDSAWRVLIDFRNWPQWMSEMASVEQQDQESPSRGTRLQVDWGGIRTLASIDRWDPPRNLQFSIDLKPSELAYGFTIQPVQKDSELLVILEMERSISRPAQALAFFLQWRLRQQGARTLSSLGARIRQPQA